MHDAMRRPTRQRTACLLTPDRLAPSDPRLTVIGAFNPGAIEHDGAIWMLVRVAETAAESRPGHTPLPRWEGGDVVIDWAANDALDPIDARVVRLKRTGMKRLTFTSHLRAVRMDDPFHVDDAALADAARLYPFSEYETFGVEDPRITRLADACYITYVAVSPHGAATALMRTRDFGHFERLGLIFPPENKDVVLFPGHVDGQYAALHRPNPNTLFHPPEMWLAYSDDLRHWGGHAALHGIGEDQPWSAGRVGAGCPPIATEHGWLELYHANTKTPDSRSAQVGAYVGALALLDHHAPSRVIAQSEAPVMVAEADFETQGFVPNVVFPTAMIERGDHYLVYYGAADAATGVTAFDKTDLLHTLTPIANEHA
jgi:predicted GH43/DUF377 family glycosyl hydrolase